MTSTKHIWRILFAQLVSSIGDQLTLVASFALLMSSGENSVIAASPLLVKGSVHLLFSFFSMHWIDRIPAKLVTIAADILRFAMVALIVIVPQPSIALVLTVQALCTFVEIFFNAAREKMISAHIDQLDTHQQNRFVALDNQVLTLTEILGFALGFLLVSGLNYRIAFAIDALTFLGSAVFLVFSKDISKTSKPDSKKLLAEIKGGINAVLQEPILLRSTAARTLFWLGAGVFNMIQLTIVSRIGLKADAAALVSLARCLEAIGFGVGLWYVHRIFQMWDGKTELEKLFRLCAVGLFIAGLTTFTLIPEGIGLLAIASFLIHGVGTGLNSFGVRRLRQLGTAKQPQLRGRVVTFSNTMAKTAEVLAMGFVTLFMHKVGFSLTLAIGAIFFLAAAHLAFRYRDLQA